MTKGLMPRGRKRLARRHELSLNDSMKLGFLILLPSVSVAVSQEIPNNRISLTAFAPRSVTLAWDGGNSAAGYRVKYWAEPDPANPRTYDQIYPIFLTVEAGTVTTVQVAPLDADAYSFVVFAYNSSGQESAPSNQVEWVATPTPTASPTPTSTRTASPTSLTLTWDASPTSDKVTGYRVYELVKSRRFLIGQSKTTHLVIPREKGKHVYVVTAVSAKGESAPAAPLEVRN